VRAGAAALWLAAAPAAALDMPLPATTTLTETLPAAVHRVATGPFAEGSLPTIAARGRLDRTVVRMAAPGATPAAILAPLRAQLEAEGWEVVFACADRACGGFEFRFEIDVAPAPAMFVDLASYRYLAARRGKAWTTLLVSTSAGEAYVQLVAVTPPDAVAPAPVTTLAAPSDLAGTLETLGRAVLPDLVFPSGAVDLPGDAYPSLSALAAFLEARPGMTVALVGHTDAEGGAEGNMAISRRRAESARALLIDRHGVDPARVDAFGVGFFAPLAPNDTPEARARNRRVEVVVTSTP
jgi:OOP family OmpA-OmpF porin